MKVTIEIDCTPEEARRAMGLPDMAAVRDTYLAQLTKMGDDAFKPEIMQALMQGWAPMGEAGMGLWRALTEAASANPKDTKR